MNKRSYTLFTYAIAIFMGVALFLTSERVQRAERVYSDIQEKLTVEREAYHIFQTEWTYLNRPDRLEDLAVTHLKLAPLKPDATLTTVVNLPTIPQKSEEEKSIVSASVLNTITPASGSDEQTNQALNTPKPVEQKAEQKEVAIATPHETITVVKVSATAKTAHDTAPTPVTRSSTLPKKTTRANRNTSTAGVTFYQYMNRNAARGSTGGAR